jgi:hypothetical protein
MTNRVAIGASTEKRLVETKRRDIVKARQQWRGPIMSKTEKAVMAAILSLLVPLVRLLLRSNVDCRQFIELAKLAYVEVATKDYGIRERPTNMSRVAFMTGMTRKEVGRLRELIESDEPTKDVKRTFCQALLNRWYEDADFLTANGERKALNLHGSKESLDELLRKEGGDMPTGAVKTEMLRMGVMKTAIDGSFKASRKDQVSESQVKRLEKDLSLIECAAMAVTHNAGEASTVWPTEEVESGLVAEDDISQLRRLSMGQIDSLKEKAEEAFAAYNTLSSDKAGGKTKVRIAMFYCEERD